MSGDHNLQKRTMMEQILIMDQRLDKFEDRMDQLEGQMALATKWLERIEKRLEQIDESRIQLIQAITKLQTESEVKTFMTDKEKDIIMKLLNNESQEKDQAARSIEGEKNRKQERFLRIWAVLGPVLASVLTSFFTQLLM
jgi:DNA replication initiation complex subunit (GINS family)